MTETSLPPPPPQRAGVCLEAWSSVGSFIEPQRVLGDTRGRPLEICYIQAPEQRAGLKTVFRLNFRK
jgi:hypothetical protein